MREQLPLYLAKLPFIPADCQLAAAEEMALLSQFGDATMRGASNRLAFLTAAAAAETADDGAAASPFGLATRKTPTLACAYPAPPKLSAPQVRGVVGGVDK